MFKTKHYLLVIAGLFIVNIITVSIILAKPKWLSASNETVATVGGETITRSEWQNEIEEKYGEIVLKDLVDQKVIEQMAKKYRITVSEKEIDREMTILKTTSYVHNQNENEEKQRNEIKNNLLLEEILTKDAVVSKKEMETFYQKNKSLFIVPDSYLVSQIVVKTKAEAEQTLKELKQGSNFSVLAMERSIDEFTSIQGGNMGYVNNQDDRISSKSLREISKTKIDSWTKPVKVKEGYAIYFLQDKIAEKKYTFKEVKNQIRRQIAIEQMGTTPSVDIFWKEAKVDWLYGDKKE